MECYSDLGYQWFQLLLTANQHSTQSGHFYLFTAKAVTLTVYLSIIDAQLRSLLTYNLNVKDLYKYKCTYQADQRNTN